ncbi:phenylacetaldoxime dehydratase family protein [Pseudomonas spelaei]
MSFHLHYPRIIDEVRPEGFAPATPKYQARWDNPLSTLVCDYLAVQHSGESRTPESDFFIRAQAAFTSEYGPDNHELMRQVDDAGLVNSIVVAYWTDPTRYAIWKHTHIFNAWFNSSEREHGPHGYWRETLLVPYDRMETIYSEPHYRAGVAKTQGCQLEAMYTAGYFGAMRDRLPISAIDRLLSPYGEDLPLASLDEQRSQRIRLAVPHNVVSIRSGQYWQQAPADQFDDYMNNLQPKLDVGMRYIQDNAATTGCLSLRSMVNLNEHGDELFETSKHGYFLSLAHLEGWAAGHKSHLDIYKHALAMRQKHGSKRAVVTWHEVFVLTATPSFEYINCHANTGLLPFANLWGHIATPL